MTANGGAQPLGDHPCRGCRRSEQCDEFISAWMGHELTLSEIGARQVENGSKDLLGIGLTVVCCQSAVLIDISDEQSDRPAPGTRLGNGCHSGVDKGVVSRESSLLIEKDWLAPEDVFPRTAGGLSTVRKRNRMAQEKRHDFAPETHDLPHLSGSSC